MLHKSLRRKQPMVNKNSGFSLVELMVAMLLSLFLLYGVIEIYVSNKRTNNLQNGFSQVQENGRMVVELISREIRGADYFGCLVGGDAIQVNLNGGYDTSLFDFSTGGIGGANDVPAGTTVGNKTVVEGTDALVLRGASDKGIKIEKPYMPTTAAALHISADSGIQQYDVLLVSDCIAGNLFETSNANPEGSNTVAHNTGTGNIGNAFKEFAKTYGADAGILQPYAKTYFIANDLNGEPSLFVSDSGVINELIPGVENMQITYGEDTTGDLAINRWVYAHTLEDADSDPATPDTHDANSVSDMGNVLAIRVVFTVRSYGSVGASGDGILRKNYTVTTNIRNRMI